MNSKGSGESREGVALTNLDQPLFDGAGATKRDLLDYLDGVADRILPELRDRPLSVIRVHRGQEAFMQKNLPKYTPDFVRTARFELPGEQALPAAVVEEGRQIAPGRVQAMHEGKRRARARCATE